MAEFLSIGFETRDKKSDNADLIFGDLADKFTQLSGYFESDEFYEDAATIDDDGVFAVMENVERDVFGSLGAAFGNPAWLEPTLIWQEFKQRVTGQNITGVFQNILKPSLSEMSDGNNIATVGGRTITWGTRVEYAEFFDDVRPVFNFADGEVQREIIRRFQRAAFRQLNNVFGGPVLREV